MVRISNVQKLNFPKIIDERGNLTFLQEGSHIPFEIKRMYWIYDVPGGEIRGGHAYKSLKEIVIALSGSFDVKIDDGSEQKIVSLNRSYTGILIPKMIWRQLENFSTNSLALIIASEDFDENDYIRDYNLYRNMNNVKQ